MSGVWVGTVSVIGDDGRVVEERREREVDGARCAIGLGIKRMRAQAAWPGYYVAVSGPTWVEERSYR